MNTLRRTAQNSILTTSIAARLGLAFMALGFAADSASAAAVAFSPARQIAGDTDVLNAGEFRWAYNMSNTAAASATVNGVAFTGSNSITALGTDVTIAGIAPTTLTNNTTAFGSAAGNPYALLSAEYKNLLKGGTYTNGAGGMTLTLNNLTVGHAYAAQIWSNDNRSLAAARNVTVSGGGGGSVLLDYNNLTVNGGVGQHTVGFFTADASTQLFSLVSPTSGQFESIQLRDVTNLGFWVGTGGATWDDATTANFAANLYNAALNTTTFNNAKAPLNAVSFGDTYWDNGAETPVTQTAVTIAAGGVSAGTVIFRNAALNYTVTSSDALGITGASNLSVTGGGTVTLLGTQSYTGSTSVAAGTLKIGSGVLNGSSDLLVGGTGRFDLNGASVGFTGGLGGSVTGVLTDDSAVAGTSTVSFLAAAGAAAPIIADGATRSLALRIANSNAAFALTNPANTFSGGITLTHTVAGTRMSPGTIVAGAYGTGTITVGEAATDRAGIFFSVANQTLANPIIANTGLGTDRVGTFRVDTTNLTLPGQLTANLADVTFSTNGTGTVTATGKITGPRGLKLLSHTLGGASMTVTLNNAAGTNDYAGNTTINENPQNARSYTLALGAADQIPDGSGKGNVIINTNGTGVGRLNLNGFSDAINGLSGNGTVDAVSGAPVFTVGGGDASGVFTGTIAGPLSLIKGGTGTQSLGGANTYTGATTVNAGKLFVNSSLAAASVVSVAGGATFGGSGSVPGAVTVNTGGAIESGNGTAAGTLTLASLALGNAGGDLSSLNLRPFASPGLNVTGTDTLLLNGGAGSVTVNILGGAPAVGTYTLIDYAGAPVAFSSFVPGTLPNRVVANLADNPANTSIDLNVTGVDSARWSGSVSSEWSTAALGAPKNWVLNSNGTTQTDYLAGDTVSFTDSATTTVVDISVANVAPNGVTFNHSTKDYTIQGSASITGTTGLTKTGTGTLTITNANTYAGQTAVEQGILSVASIGNTGVNGPLGSGSSLGLGGAATTGTLRYTGPTGATNRAIGLGAGGGILEIADGAANLTASGVISGGGLTKAGPGTLTLPGANTFTGGFTVSQGIVVAGSATALGATGNAISVASGATLDMNAQTLQGYTQNIMIAGPGADPTLGALGNSSLTTNLNTIRGITLTADASIGGNNPAQVGRWDIGRVDFNVDPTITIDHINGGGFTLTKVGAGYIGLLTGAINLAGFVMNGGTVAPHENTSFGAASVTINNGSVLIPWGTNIAFANNFTVNNGVFQNAGHNNFYNGTMAINGPTTVSPVATGNIYFDGVVTGSGDITKTGALSFFLGGNSSGYTGTFTNAQSNTFFSSATAGSASAAFVVNAGNLGARVPGSSVIELGSLAGSGGQVGNDLAGTDATFRIGGNNSSTTYSGNILDTLGGGGTIGINKVGTGTLTLAGTNTYTGATTIDAGTLIISGSLTASAVTVNASGTLSGSGVIGGGITMAAGAKIAPGASIGTLTSGPLSFSSGSIFELEINTTTGLSDVLAINGSLSLADADNAILTISDLSPGVYAGAPIPFITYTGGWDGDLFTYAGNIVPDGGLITVGGNQFNLDYDLGGNSVALVVPEPGAATALLGGLAVLLGVRRRRS